MLTDLDLVIFDMAGTTVRDEGQVPRAFSEALAEYGLATGPDAIRALRGASKRQAILDLLPPGADRVALADRVFDAFRDALARGFAAGVHAVDGAPEAFAWLRERNIRVALNTGFDRVTTGMLLCALGWTEGRVDAVVCGDDVPRGRPAPYLVFRCIEAAGVESVRRVMTVGDTVLDLQAGNNAGARYNVGVLSGAHGRQELEAQPHTHIIGSVADIPGLVSGA